MRSKPRSEHLSAPGIGALRPAGGLAVVLLAIGTGTGTPAKAACTAEEILRLVDAGFSTDRIREFCGSTQATRPDAAPAAAEATGGGTATSGRTQADGRSVVGAGPADAPGSPETFSAPGGPAAADAPGGPDTLTTPGPSGAPGGDVAADAPAPPGAGAGAAGAGFLSALMGDTGGLPDTAAVVNAIQRTLAAPDARSRCDTIVADACARDAPTAGDVAQCVQVNALALAAFESPGEATVVPLVEATNDSASWCVLRELVSAQMNCFYLGSWLDTHTPEAQASELFNRCAWTTSD